MAVTPFCLCFAVREFHPQGWLHKSICWPAPWENCSNKQEASSQRRERGTFFVEYWQLGENKKSWNVIPGDPVEWRQRDRSWPGNPPALLALPCQGTGWLLPGLSQIQKNKHTNANTQIQLHRLYKDRHIQIHKYFLPWNWMVFEKASFHLSDRVRTIQ